MLPGRRDPCAELRGGFPGWAPCRRTSCPRETLPAPCGGKAHGEMHLRRPGNAARRPAWLVSDASRKTLPRKSSFDHRAQSRLVPVAVGCERAFPFLPLRLAGPRPWAGRPQVTELGEAEQCQAVRRSKRPGPAPTRPGGPGTPPKAPHPVKGSSLRGGENPCGV